MARKSFSFVLTFFLLAAVTGCLKNDMSYPDVKPAITAIRFEGQVGDAVIDNATRTVTVDIYETVDLSSVKLLEISSNYDSIISFGAGVVQNASETYMDLRNPVVVTVSVYESFEWTIIARQEIVRYFKIRNQVGSEDINNEEKMVVVKVAESNPLSEIEVLEAKLGMEGSVIAPDFREVHDFTDLVYFDVSYGETSEKWGVRVLPWEVGLGISSVNAWAFSADVTGSVSGNAAETVFEYKKASDESWTRFEGDVSVDGINVSATIAGLQDDTDYVVRMVSGEEHSAEFDFHTEAAVQLPNSSYDAWFQSSKGAWFPRASEDAETWWDTANMGANTLGPVNPTTPEDDFLAVAGEGKRAARLETKSVLGVMAAGNLYSGRYKGTEGLSALLEFGVPFESRPIGLRGYYSYEPAVINKVDEPYEDLMGRTDMCQIYIMLTAWDKPFDVNSTKRQYIDMDDPDILAFRELVTDKSTNGEWVEFFIHLDDEAWRDKARKATHIVVISCASRYGNYFTGGVGSLLYVDEFELVYDESTVPRDGSVVIVDKDYVNSNADIGDRE